MQRLKVGQIERHVANMLVNSLHVLLLECDHLLLLALVLDFLRPLPLDLQHLALLRVVHRTVVEVQQFLSL